MPGPNLLTGNDSTFDTGLGSWQAAAGTLARSTAQAQSGAASAAMTASSGMPPAAQMATPNVQVTPGVTYMMGAYFRAGSTARICRFWINWYSSGGSLVSQTTVGQNNATSAGWVFARNAWPAPAGAATAILNIQVVTPNAGEVFYADTVTLNVLSAYEAIVFADRPILHWPLGETSGAAAADISIAGAAYTGGTHPGTLAASGVRFASTTGAPLTSPYAAQFDGLTGGGTNLIDSAWNPVLTSMSVECWIRPVSGTTQGIQHLFSNAEVASGQPRGYRFMINAGAPMWWFGTNTAYVNVQGGGQAVTGTQWHHLVATVGGGRYTMYLNGQQIANYSYTGTFTPTGAGTNSGMAGTSRSSGSQSLVGYLAQLAVYDTILTDVQVAAHYRAGLTVTTASLPNGVQGTSYTAALGADGGVGPYIWNASGLPPGLTVISGTVSGTPTTAGQFTPTITVTDSRGLTASATLPAITIATAMSITTTSLPQGTPGVPYTTTVAATGGVAPLTWAASGLPPGLSMSTAGVISGTPVGATQGTVGVTVTDSHGQTAQRSFTLRVALPVSISWTATEPSGVTGTPWTLDLVAGGGIAPYTWAVTGSVPPGLSMSGATGPGTTVTGTPTATGTYSFTVTLTDSTGDAVSRNFALTVVNPLVITTLSLMDATVGFTYFQGLTGTGGNGFFTWSATGLPAGLTIVAARIEGTPTQDGTYTVTLTLADSGSGAPPATATFTLTVLKIPPEITSSLPDAIVGEPYSQTLTAAGGLPPYTWEVTGLPFGLELSGDTVSGAALVPGPYTVTITCTDADGAVATATQPMWIGWDTLTIISDLPDGTAGQPYTAELAADGGTPPYAWSTDGLPAGLVSDEFGRISGMPTVWGDFDVTVIVGDAAPEPARRGRKKAAARAQVTAILPLHIAPPLPLTVEPTLPTDLNAGTTGTWSLGASGGIPPYSYVVTGLPPGMFQQGSTITGTPDTPGDYVVTVTVTDLAGTQTGTTFRIRIAARPIAVWWDGLECSPGWVDQWYTAVVTDVAGWYDTPPNQGHDATLVLADGGVYGPKTLDPRVITVQGAAAGPRGQLMAFRDQLAQRTVARQPALLVIEDWTQGRRQATVRASTDQLTFAWLAGSQGFTWQVVLTANDPRIYGTDEESVVLRTGEEGSTGRTYPRTYPWNYGEGGLPNMAVLNNRGDTNAPVTAVYTGPLSQTRMNAGGSPTGIIVGPLTDGETVTVHCETLVARAPGGAIRQQLIGAGSKPMPLPPGSQTWWLWGTGDGTVTLTWRPTWL